MPQPHFIYLASASPRRAQLLDQLGVRHRPLLPGPEEDAEALEAEFAGEGPADYVSRVTRAKLQAARRRLRVRGLAPAPILVADTTVALGRRILAKPADAAHAAAMLRALSGRTHHVYTAVAVGRARRTDLASVSYTHRDVYKRQGVARAPSLRGRAPGAKAAFPARSPSGEGFRR